MIAVSFTGAQGYLMLNSACLWHAQVTVKKLTVNKVIENILDGRTNEYVRPGKERALAKIRLV
jgi:hypothetical protein